MGIAECAAAAAAVFGQAIVHTDTQGDLPLGLVMLCIGGPESGWDPTAQGDTPRELESAGYPPPPWNMTCPQGSSNGSSAWGWLQINWSHHEYLTEQSGSDSPCAWYHWLSDPAHCAQAALALIGTADSYDESQITGGPWLADRGKWEAQLPKVRPFWDAAVGTGPGVGVVGGIILTYTPSWVSPALVGTAAGGIALAAAITGVLKVTGHLRHRREHGMWPYRFEQRAHQAERWIERHLPHRR